jgi:hypothetical protein
MPRTPKKPWPRRRLEPPVSPPGAPSTLRVFLEVLRLPVPPARTMMEFVTRMAFWAFALGGVVLVAGGSARLTVMERTFDFLWLLAMLGALDQWAFVPALRALGKLGGLWLARLRGDG